MARAGARGTIAVRTQTLEGSKVLEWKPRLITVILVVVLVGLVAGWFGDFGDSVPMNWEW
jgi:hypothetical protein